MVSNTCSMYSRPVDRFHELEDLRRSLAMLPPGTAGLSREDAMRLIGEVQGLEDRLRRLRAGLGRLLQEATEG
jgi:hypothetical protein